jgi:prepilin-type N-terminal cleavage/methylation domain-containing protein
MFFKENYMKKQAGFSLIELLLVIAIISIIIVIAIPSFYSQRSRARNMAVEANLVGRLGDLLAQYDKLNEEGYTQSAIASLMGNYLRETVGVKDKNPWSGTANATASPFDYTIAVTGGTLQTKSAFETKDLMAYGSVLGRPKFVIQFATMSAPAFLGGVVLKQGKDKDGNQKFVKSVSLE